MTKIHPGREVMVVGVGLHPFGRFPDKDLSALAIEAVVPALQDAGVKWKDIAIAYFGHVYYQGMSVGETTLSKLGLTGDEVISITGLEGDMTPRQTVTATITYTDGTVKEIDLLCRIDTEVEIEYVEHGGVLHYVLRNLAAA